MTKLQKVIILRRKLCCACCLFLVGLSIIFIIIGLQPGVRYWLQVISLQRKVYISPRKYLNFVHTIPIALDGKNQPYPPFLKHHMTRYAKGCLDPIIESLRNDSHQTILPWVHQFDHIYASCGITWFAPQDVANITCLFLMPPNVTSIHRYRDPTSEGKPKVLRVHVSNELPRYHDHFVENVLPFYEEEWRNGTLGGVLIHSGSGDTPVPENVAWAIVQSPVVVRWVVEQNIIDELADHPNVVQLPTGLCAARAYGSDGALLQRMMHAGSVKPWKERRNRVFFCFHMRYPHRHFYMHFAEDRCTICDICSPRQQPGSHLQYTTTLVALWQAYTEYKYVFAPTGNGPDCGRTWEIMLMGGIPVMEHFTGARGYPQGGLTVIIIRNESELTESSLQRWQGLYTSGTKPYRLRRLHWVKRAFAGLYSATTRS